MPTVTDGADAPLLAPDFLRRLEGLELVSKKLLAGRMKGDRLSKRKGRGSEFADYRPYSMGDDLRFLDWNLYGRVEKLFLRLYREEEDLNVFLLIDTSRSMGFGSPTKFRYAKQVAAALGFVGLVNVDDARRYQAFGYVDNGELRVSVPTGNYSLIADVPEFTADGAYVGRVVNVSDFAVTGAATLPAVDARTARTEVGVTTPRPATVDIAAVDWTRGTAEGSLGYGTSVGGGGGRLLVAPGAPARRGFLRWDNSWRLTGPGGAYTYDLKWSADGAVPTRQRFAATAANLATLATSYYSETDRTIFSTRFSTLPGDFAAFGVGLPVDVPRTRPEYVGGDRRVNWTQAIDGVVYVDETIFLIADRWLDGGRRYAPGQTVTVRWQKPPLHPTLTRTTGEEWLGYVCPACRVGDELVLALNPLGDTDPTHVGFLDDYGDTPLGPITADTRLRVWRGTTLLSDETDVVGTVVAVPAGDRAYRVRYEQRRTVPWSTLATAADTEWTFRSARPADGSVPTGPTCPGTGPCAALPMLVPNYEVPTDLRGRVAAGPGQVVLAVSGNEGAPASPVDKATLSWSTDDGATWTAVPVRSRGGGRFAATVPNPAGATVSLRITAADRAGDTVTQTLVRAYAVR